jgi:hypothetical protein
MAFFTLDEAYAAADLATRSGRTLDEHRRTAQLKSSFDIFLSHSSADARLIQEAKALLEARGLSVYIDWIDDPQLDRSHVTKATAAVLRRRMKQCSSFLYATSTNASSSRWMPWELGYFDGLRNERIGIFPLTSSSSSTFEGQEYLGLYPYFEKITDTDTKKPEPGFLRENYSYTPLSNFVAGSSAIRYGYR